MRRTEVGTGGGEANGRVVEPDLQSFASGTETDGEDEIDSKGPEEDEPDEDDTDEENSDSTDSDAETSSTVSFPAAPTPKNTVMDPATMTINVLDGRGARGGEWAVHPDYADVFGPGIPIEAHEESPEGTRTPRQDRQEDDTGLRNDRVIDVLPNNEAGIITPIHIRNSATSHPIGLETPSQVSTDHYYVPTSLHSGAPLLSPFTTNDSFKSDLEDQTLPTLTMDPGFPVDHPQRPHPSVRIQPDSFNRTIRDGQTTTTGSSGWANLGSVFSRRSSESGAISMTPDEKQRLRDEKRLEQMGYSQVLGRDYGFWSNFAVGFCNIGVSGTCTSEGSMAESILFSSLRQCREASSES
jgi:hypothetical protein